MANWNEPRIDYKPSDQVVPSIFNVLGENERYLQEVKITTEQVQSALVSSIESSIRVNLTENETIKAAFGKIRKYFADLKSLAFAGAVQTADISNGAVTDEKIKSVAASKVTGLARVATTGDYNDLINKPSAGGYKKVVCSIERNYPNFERGLYIAFMRLDNRGGFTSIASFGIISTGSTDNGVYGAASYAYSGDFGPCMLIVNSDERGVSFSIHASEDNSKFPDGHIYPDESVQLVLYKIADLPEVKADFEDNTI